MSNTSENETSDILSGNRVVFVGRLASMARRDAARLARQHGAVVAEKPGPTVDLIVLGEEGLPLPDSGLHDDLFDADTRQAIDEGRVEVVSETQFWQRLGLVEAEHDVQRLYTPAMLAELLSVPLEVVRRWHRRGLIVPVREVRRLPYFDFREVATARCLAELLAAGASPRVIEKKLAALARYVPNVDRPLAQLSVIIEGKQILLRQGDGLLEPGGQLRFDFQSAEPAAAPTEPMPVDEPADAADKLLSLAEHGELAKLATSPERMIELAAELEESGHLEVASEVYRAVMAAAGPSPELCFQVGELLYRLGDSAGARERYYMAIELDEDYVEARANLGCVLAETGCSELAVAAFEGALSHHPDYADVHYHLARTLDELDRRQEAERHWQIFLELAPDSPWANEAHDRLTST